MSLRFSQGSVGRGSGQTGSSPSSRTGSLNVRDLENEKGELKLNKLLESRVLTGFLRQYAESQFSAESLAFIQAEQDFQQHYADFERRGAVEEEVQKLYSKYLCDSSMDMQICMKSEESEQVEKIMKEKLYSRHMFHFLVRLCRLTVERDIYPRFKTTAFYKEMKECMAEPIKDWVKNLDFLSGPSALLAEDSSVDISDDSLRFSLDQVLSDHGLGSIFLKWVRDNFASSNQSSVALLECVLMSLLYKNYWDETDEESGDMRTRSFGIYFSFLHPASDTRLPDIPKEVRHHVGSSLSLKKPPKTLFDELLSLLRKRVEELLWAPFIVSNEYADMVKTLRKVGAARTDGNSASCLVM